MKLKQSLAGYIREHLNELEARLENGIRQEVIVEELAEKGYETTLQTLRNLIYRARKRRSLKAQADQPRDPKIVSATSGKKKKQPSSFEYSGTQDLDESDLI